MPRPEDPFEAASYDLKQFRERRMAERRATMREGTDRRLYWKDVRMISELVRPRERADEHKS